MEGVRREGLDRICVVGELALSGAVRPVRGVLPLALMARAAGFTAMMVPAENAEAAAESLLRAAMQELQLSARAYDRILKVARTVADLAGREGIVAGDVAEAVGYRSLDRPMV